LSTSPYFDVETTNGATVVTVAGPKLPPEATEPLGELVASAGAGRVVLEFSRVTFLSSSALGAVAMLKKRLDESGGSLRLCHLAPELVALFQITKLDSIIPICETRSAAIEGA
jgi:anti-sigma B factor antagonist